MIDKIYNTTKATLDGCPLAPSYAILLPVIYEIRRPIPMTRLDPLRDYTRIGEETGLTPRHVSRVLRGVRRTTEVTLQRIADAVGMDVGELRMRVKAARRSRQ